MVLEVRPPWGTEGPTGVTALPPAPPPPPGHQHLSRWSHTLPVPRVLGVPLAPACAAAICAAGAALGLGAPGLVHRHLPGLCGPGVHLDATRAGAAAGPRPRCGGVRVQVRVPGPRVADIGLPIALLLCAGTGGTAGRGGLGGDTGAAFRVWSPRVPTVSQDPAHTWRIPSRTSDCPQAPLSERAPPPCGGHRSQEATPHGGKNGAQCQWGALPSPGRGQGAPSAPSSCCSLCRVGRRLRRSWWLALSSRSRWPERKAQPV